MSKIQELIDARNEAEEALDRTRTELQEFIFPIIKAAGIGEPRGEWITRIETYNGNLNVTTEWSARNCSNNSDYKIPMSILNAKDPIAEAEKYKRNKELLQKAADRANTLAQIERLQKTL